MVRGAGLKKQRNSLLDVYGNRRDWSRDGATYVEEGGVSPETLLGVEFGMVAAVALDIVAAAALGMAVVAALGMVVAVALGMAPRLAKAAALACAEAFGILAICFSMAIVLLLNCPPPTLGIAADPGLSIALEARRAAAVLDMAAELGTAVVELGKRAGLEAAEELGMTGGALLVAAELGRRLLVIAAIAAA